ncbi:hypothetical protein C8R44DRAFT_947757 [Mycena epipterygia]|nr:hypothetical protein C8R44DRAFT_947757 [Mycena epipterygia]
MEFSTVHGAQISPHLNACAKLFSDNYGVWGLHAAELSSKPGARVKMSPAKLRAECLSDPEHTQLALCSINEFWFFLMELVGHAFATSWSYEDGVVCWITQLVVSTAHRRKGIATMLLRLLRNCGAYDVFGLASSHPAACIALSKLGRSHWIGTTDLEFIRANAAKVLRATPVAYLQGVKPAGTVFNSCASKAVSVVFTKFFVDHGEPLEAMEQFQKEYGDIWPLGELPEGHEFLILVKAPNHI